MFRIVTIEREFGCGGGTIGAQLADQLGWTLWDHSLSEEIARIANVDCSTVRRCEERVDSRFHRLTKAFWRGSYERGIPLDNSQMFDTDCMVDMMQQIMDRIAETGNAVIVGRGAPYFLRDRSDTLRVFTYAPREEKIRRLCEGSMGRPEAEESVDTVDRERMAYVKHYFDADWPTRALYHLMINTAIGDENVLATIHNTMKLLDQLSETRSPQLRGVL
jgi:cytidylate kinase